MAYSVSDQGPAAPASVVAALNDVAYHYPTGAVALRHLTLAIGQGNRIAISGPSGCGKSTLLSLLCGFLKPTAGSVTVTLPPGPARHPISMAFQSDTLLPWLTVFDNATLFARFQKRGSLNKNEVAERVNWLLETVGLGKWKNAYPYQLSGGMKRRAAFVAAVAPFPQILLMDEPFASVDEPSRVEIHQDVNNVANELNMTVVLVTHDLAEAISICDEVVILSASPGTIAWRGQVPFGRERNVQEMRHEPAFLEMYGELWARLSEQMQGRERPVPPVGEK